MNQAGHGGSVAEPGYHICEHAIQYLSSLKGREGKGREYFITIII